MNVIARSADNLAAAAKDKAFILVGTKCDLEMQRQVTQDEAQRFANTAFKSANITMPFYETSAKENQNVEEVFNTIMEKAWKVKKQLAISASVEASKKSNKSGWFASASSNDGMIDEDLAYVAKKK